MEKTQCKIAEYLLQRLHEHGLKHMFGVPGDYVLDFMDRVLESPIELIGTCNELNAGYAADGYARLNGIGAVTVTYGVGAFSVLNAIAGAFAERVPLVVINGAPRMAQQLANTPMHHLAGSYSTQLDMFRHITLDAVALNDAETAPERIDRAIARALSQQGPVYFEIPVDMVDVPCRAPLPMPPLAPPQSDPQALEECVNEAAQMLNQAENPVILLGAEIHRFRLGEAVMKLVEHAEIPFATGIDGKSVLPEEHPQFMGVYLGAMSRDVVRSQVENCDGLLTLGTHTNDISSGIFTARLPGQCTVAANLSRVRVRSHFYDRVWLGDFITALTAKLKPRSFLHSHPTAPHRPSGSFAPVAGAKLLPARFYDCLNHFIGDDDILLAEAGDAMFAACELNVNDAENFVSQSFYLSIGYTLPATLGACLARPGKRPLLMIGDGSFQMTAQELSTLGRHNCNPIIILLNNDGYVIERLIHDGPYNDIQQWNYHLLPEAFAARNALALEVHTEDALVAALDRARQASDKLVFLNVHLPRDQGCEALARLGKELRKLQKQ